MQLKLLQAEQEETRGAIEEEKEKQKKVRETFQLLLFLLFLATPCPPLLSVCLSFFSSSLAGAILYLPAFVGRG